jgi:hypothetical protein
MEHSDHSTEARNSKAPASPEDALHQAGGELLGRQTVQLIAKILRWRRYGHSQSAQGIGFRGSC